MIYTIEPGGSSNLKVHFYTHETTGNNNSDTYKIVLDCSDGGQGFCVNGDHVDHVEFSVCGNWELHDLCLCFEAIAGLPKKDFLTVR